MFKVVNYMLFNVYLEKFMVIKIIIIQVLFGRFIKMYRKFIFQMKFYKLSY